MPQFTPQTLTAAEQKAILAAARGHPRACSLISLALGTGLWLAEVVGLEVGDVFHADGTARTRL